MPRDISFQMTMLEGKASRRTLHRSDQQAGDDETSLSRTEYKNMRIYNNDEFMHECHQSLLWMNARESLMHDGTNAPEAALLHVGCT